ncbi:MAG: hypothetical protein KDD70_03840, partial [Bdellovibrionales bacterium]|nr:hypothetical protein [Bdellovibrionales bacterium]
RDAGYDLVLVGVIENPRSIDEISAFSKLIEVESGITVWNGRSSVSTNRNTRKKTFPSSWWSDNTTSLPQTNLLLEELASCLTNNVLHEDPSPED